MYEELKARLLAWTKTSSSFGLDSIGKDIAAALEAIEELERQRDLAVSELETIATGFDCDNDAHRYGAYCRKCEATKALTAIKESDV